MINIAVSEWEKNADITRKTIKKSAFDSLLEPDVIQTISLKDDFTEDLKEYNIFFLEIDGTTEKSDVTKLRKYSPASHFVIMCAEKVNPMDWIKPDVRPSAITTFPLKAAKAKEILQEIVGVEEKDEEETTFCVRRGGNDKFVKISQIVYFEARDKKMVLCTYGQEIEFYSTFGDITEQLGNEMFFRSHKGFLINLDKVKEIDYAGNTVTMDNDDTIPISRTAKSTLKQIITERVK